MKRQNNPICLIGQKQIVNFKGIMQKTWNSFLLICLFPLSLTCRSLFCLPCPLFFGGGEPQLGWQLDLMLLCRSLGKNPLQRPCCQRGVLLFWGYRVQEGECQRVVTKRLRSDQAKWGYTTRFTPHLEQCKRTRCLKKINPSKQNLK